MIELADGIKVGEFRGRCPGKSPCFGTVFSSYVEFEAHMTAEHRDVLNRYRHRKTWDNSAPYDTTPRKKPYGQPAVSPAKQRVTPGEHFTLEGRACQVIGQVSVTRVRVLMWAEQGDGPKYKCAVSHGEDGDLVIWDVALSIKDVLAAIKASRGDA